MRSMLFHYCLHTENFWGIGRRGETGQNKTFNNFKLQTGWTYFSYWTYCPRSSMDRVTDFESGGCAFDPHRGHFSFLINGCWIIARTHPTLADSSGTYFSWFLLGAPCQWWNRSKITTQFQAWKWNGYSIQVSKFYVRLSRSMTNPEYPPVRKLTLH